MVKCLRDAVLALSKHVPNGVALNVYVSFITLVYPVWDGFWLLIVAQWHHIIVKKIDLENVLPYDTKPLPTATNDDLLSIQLFGNEWNYDKNTIIFQRENYFDMSNEKWNEKCPPFCLSINFLQ